LAFGQPWSKIDSFCNCRVYGTNLPATTHFFSNQGAVNTAVQFALGYQAGVSVYGQPYSTLTLLLGTSNYNFDGVVNNTGISAYQYGQEWHDQVEHPVYTEVASQQVSPLAANDIEPAWAGPANSKSWVDGYTSVANGPVFNFGSADGCELNAL